MDQNKITLQENCSTNYLTRAPTLFQWKIPNFSSFSTDMSVEAIRKISPTFSTNFHDSKWYLRLDCFSGHEKENNVSLYLNLKTKNNVSAYAAFYILNVFGEKTNRCSLAPKDFTATQCSWGFREFIKRETLFNPELNLLPLDTITIFCELNVLTDDWYETMDIPGKYETVNDKLIHEYNEIFENKDFADVTFFFKEKTLRGHSAIIGAHSSVFMTMFKANSQKPEKIEVNVFDTSFDIFYEMLRFVYTGKMEESEQSVTQVLKLAFQYKIKSLKLKCEEILSKILRTHNAIDILILADTYDAVSLKEIVLNFISNHKHIIKDSVVDKMAAYPHLLKKIWRICLGSEMKELKD